MSAATVPMSEDDYRSASQRWVDEVCHYRNLAIRLGASPDDMLDKGDRALCESGVVEDGWADEDRAERAEAWQLLEDIAGSGVALEDRRLGYVEVQIDRETWAALQKDYAS